MLSRVNLNFEEVEVSVDDLKATAPSLSCTAWWCQPTGACMINLNDKKNYSKIWDEYLNIRAGSLQY